MPINHVAKENVKQALYLVCLIVSIIFRMNTFIYIGRFLQKKSQCLLKSTPCLQSMGALEPSCRLCLTSPLSPPFTLLPEDPKLAEAVGSVLQLETRLGDPALHPQHLCQQCSQVLLPALSLQQLARRCERFVLKHQKSILEVGVRKARSMLDQEEVMAEEVVVEMESDQNEMHCPICGPSRVLKKSSLVNHLRLFHKEKDIDCDIEGCDIKFKKKGDMKKHIRNVHNNEKSLCVLCGESFKDLNYHIKVAHENVQHACLVCSKVYSSKQGLNFHMKHSHGEGKKEVCHICAVEVKHVRHHIKMKHSGSVEKNVPCQEVDCDRMFRTKQEATIHYNSAHLNKKEMCPLCKGWFKNLYTHIHQTHNNEKKHVCDLCGKAFGKKNDLKVHKDRIHLMKRYVCPKCGKTISKIREHLKTVHNMSAVNMEEIEEAPSSTNQPPASLPTKEVPSSPSTPATHEPSDTASLRQEGWGL